MRLTVRLSVLPESVSFLPVDVSDLSGPMLEPALKMLKIFENVLPQYKNPDFVLLFGIGAKAGGIGIGRAGLTGGVLSIGTGCVVGGENGGGASLGGEERRAFCMLTISMLISD